MTKPIMEIIKKTKKKYGLDKYFLKNYEIEREVNFFNETVYKLVMEWIPEDYIGEEAEELNPPGTAVIELELPSQKTNVILFVHEQNKASKKLFKGNKTEDILAFIESETGLIYEEDFFLQAKREDVYIFQACYQKVPLYPEGYIEVKLNKQGQLIHLIKLGQFPENKTVREQDFTLNQANVLRQAEQMVSLFQLPDDESERFEKFYGIEETFITNDEKQILPYHELYSARPILHINKLMTWDRDDDLSRDLKEVEEENLDLKLDIITYEQFLAREPSADVKVFKEINEKKVIERSRAFLYELDPFDSGHWTLSEIFVDSGKIHVNLRLTEDELGLEKILLILDPETYQVVNFLSNEELAFASMMYGEAKKPKLSKEEAYKKLKQDITIQPYYVYQRTLDQYILCGRISSEYGVHALSGQVLNYKE